MKPTKAMLKEEMKDNELKILQLKRQINELERINLNKQEELMSLDQSQWFNNESQKPQSSLHKVRNPYTGEFVYMDDKKFKSYEETGPQLWFR